MLIRFVPESPRYLTAKGKHEKALNILAKAHAQGNQEDEVVQIEYREIQETIKLEQEFEGNGWTELWRTPGNRHRLVILISLSFFSQWSGNGLVSYYMTDVLNAAQITNKQTQLAINGILNIINALVAFMCASSSINWDVVLYSWLRRAACACHSFLDYNCTIRCGQSCRGSKC